RLQKVAGSRLDGRGDRTGGSFIMSPRTRCGAQRLWMLESKGRTTIPSLDSSQETKKGGTRSE
ncbi:MAG: hypothetical protein ACNS61_10795, partial [Candidatus Wenzhouxiangella sp. M2_3B_020]